MELLPAFAAYLALCGLVAYEAKREGRFGVGILVFSLLLTPIVTLWYLVVTSDSRDYGEDGGRDARPAPVPTAPHERGRDRFRHSGTEGR